MHPRLWKLLNSDERDKVVKAKKGKGAKDTDGGLGKQYNIHQQLSSLPKGTILVPVKPQADQKAQTNNVSATPSTDTLNAPNPVPAVEESNKIRATNFLQLANGNFVVSKTSFQISPKVADRMSVQSYTQRSKSKGLLWIDSGTNVSAMGRSCQLIEEAGHHADMTGFANDLVKENVPIGSGLTKCTDKRHGYEFLLGLHEAPYLETNESSLLSTGQSREAGIWISDVLRRHGGDQCLVAPVEGTEEMIDLDLEVKDGLLALECHYPSDKDLQDLPRVWLTNNEVPWDPNVLEEDTSITVPSCWDGESEFLLATNTKPDAPNNINKFGEYHFQNQ